MRYLVQLKPVGPFFFGGEHSRASRDSYIVHSKNMPSQSTLFGILRYLGIEDPQASYTIDKRHIGATSFRLTGSANEFGKIHNISPLYLIDTEGKAYVRAPYLDCERVNKESQLPEDYDNKEGLRYGWSYQQEYISEDELLASQMQIHIQKKAKTQGLFKKERKLFQPEYTDYAYGFIADVEEGYFWGKTNAVVYA